MPLDPALRTLLDQFEALGGPPLEDQTPEQARAAYATIAALSGTPAEVAAVEARHAGGVPVRVYVPESGTVPRPAIVYFHGGGFVIGDLDSHDVQCRALANTVGAVVVNVDYRLAPEHRFPAAADDCYEATRWVHDHAAELGVDPDRLAVAGDSAGGNLAAVTAIAARDRGVPPLRLQLLIYPVVDLTLSQPSISDNGEGYLLTASGLTWFYRHYLGETGEPKDPRCSPLFADDLSGVAPAHIITAEFDPLRDEGEAYAERLREAGVPAVVTRYPGMIHGFMQMGAVVEGGRTVMDDASAALRDALSVR